MPSGLEARLDAADRCEHIIAIFVSEASRWTHKAWDVMSEEMKEATGEPLKADPSLFDRLTAPLGGPPLFPLPPSRTAVQRPGLPVGVATEQYMRVSHAQPVALWVVGGHRVVLSPA